MTEIHPTAIIEPSVQLGEDVKIGPYVIIKDKVVLGQGSEVAPFAILEGYTTLGEKCKVFQGASVGAVPQDLKFKGEETYLKIGDNCTIREYATIHRGTTSSFETVIGNNVLLMAYTHIAHDCKIGNNVVIANSTELSGHVEIHDNAILGGKCGIQQFVRIGKYSFIGGSTMLRQDVPPFSRVSDFEAKWYGLNIIGLERNGFSKEQISNLKNAYNILFRSGLTVNVAVEKIKNTYLDDLNIKYLINFIENSKKGLTRK